MAYDRQLDRRQLATTSRGRAEPRRAVDGVARSGVYRAARMPSPRATELGHNIARMSIFPRSADAGANVAALLRASSSGGQPLPLEIRDRLETALPLDLSPVRVHTDVHADHLARALSATAFTSGWNMFFQSGAYDPSSRAGQRLLAHEAAHVVQQAAGPVAGTAIPGGLTVSDPDDAFERAADVTAAHVDSLTSSGFAGRTIQPSADLRLPGAIQRKGEKYTVKKLAKKELDQLQPLAITFAGHMTPLQQAAFTAGNKAVRNAFVLAQFPVYGMRVGDLVEVGGFAHLESRAAEYGEGGSVLTSVKLRFRDNAGASFQERAELDGLFLDHAGAVVRIVSAKLNPAAVSPAQDRALLTLYYDLRIRHPAESDTGYRGYLAGKFVGVLPMVLAANNIVGMNVQYVANGGMVTVPLEAFRQQHPLKAGSVAATPVVGLTPRPTTAAGQHTAAQRGDVLLTRTQSELVDAFADLVLNLIP